MVVVVGGINVYYTTWIGCGGGNGRTLDLVIGETLVYSGIQMVFIIWTKIQTVLVM